MLKFAGAVGLEVLLPDLVAVDVRDRLVERRRQVVGDGVQRPDHRAVVALQGGGGQLGRVAPVLDALDRAVVLLPRTGRLALGELELPVVARGVAGVLDRRPQEARALVAQDVLLGVVAAGYSPADASVYSGLSPCISQLWPSAEFVPMSYALS